MWRWMFYALIIGMSLGCSTLQVSQDYDPQTDFSLLRTFAWQNDTQPKYDDIRLNNSLMDARIRSAVEQSLISAGFKKTSRQAAEFLMAYDLAIQKQIESQPQSGVGFGFGFGGPHGGILISSGSDVRSYDEGLLQIDVLEAGSGRLLWRGKASDRFVQHADPEKNAQAINETVTKVMAQFPPAGK